ncbi:nucleotide exchange factor GrpE [Methylophilaceae bacterium]|jgi:molecular chaperone GrpE|nr:nucleotide exchange factor GrpE [Methylophilaceae bacterium]
MAKNKSNSKNDSDDIQNQEEFNLNEESLSENPSSANLDENQTDQTNDYEQQIEELKNQVLYAKAETENVRRRGFEDAEKTRKYALESFSQELLTVKDSLEASLNSETIDLTTLKDGVELTLKQLNSVFEKFNIDEINPIDEKFNPNEHQAISMIESEDKEANTILNVLQKGYKLNERVIRPAMVVVSKLKD